MKINRGKNSNKFCGPNALAALTGRHVDETAYALRIVSRKRAIKGTFNRHMLAALDLLGYRTVSVPTGALGRGGKAPTLTQALRGALRGRKASQAFLVVITGHYVTIQGRKLWDNKHPEGVSLTECPYRRRRVRAIWAVEQGRAATSPLPPRPMTLSKFTDALGVLGLETDSEYIDAPEHFQFRSGLHSVAITGTYEEALESLKYEFPLSPCPADCDCRDEGVAAGYLTT